MGTRNEPEARSTSSNTGPRDCAGDQQRRNAEAAVKRLDFTLPAFVRTAWVSDEVRNVYEPRIRSLARAWSEIEWRSVHAGVRRSALCLVGAESYESLCARVAECGLKTLPLRVEEASTSQGAARVKQVLLHVFVGKGKDAKVFKSAWIRQDSDCLGELLGYPSCCRKFFMQCCVRQRFADPTWFIAGNTEDVEREGTTSTVSGPPLLNILLRRVNVRALPHFPCRFNCPDSQTLANRLADLGRSLGFSDEMEWLSEMLSWPVEWSALHGIAEIRSPILKVCTQTDATADKYTVRWVGKVYPPDGARGVVFPYTSQAPIAIKRV